MPPSLKDNLRKFVLRLVGWLARVHKLEAMPNAENCNRPLRLLFLQYEVALGSAVNMTPVFAALKEAMPQAHVTVAAAGAALAVLQENPFIDDIVETPGPNHHLPRAILAMRRIAAERGPFDYAITNGGGMKAREAFLGMVSGARLRVGYTTAPELYNLPLALDPKASVLNNSVRVLSAFNIAIENPRPQLFYPQAVADAAGSLLIRNGIVGERPVIALITQTSGGQPSRWFDDRFAEVSDRVASRHGARIVFLGAAHESTAIEKIRGLMHAPSVNLAGQTDVALLTALMCRCDAAVTLDTGSMHVGRAVGLPMVIIASAWQPAYEWLPLGLHSCRILRRDIYRCPGCEKFVCATRACMDEITVRHVEEAVAALLLDYPASNTARCQRIERCLVPHSRGEQGAGRVAP